MANNRISPKERGLIKGALRRVFSRSDLRREVLQESIVPGHKDPNRPRVTKWSKCSMCSVMTPTYKRDVDHIIPVIPINKTQDQLTFDELVDNIWCVKSNLQTLCENCHNAKSKLENSLRRAYKKSLKEIKNG